MTKKDASNSVLILSKDQIAQKVNRIAYQILEDNLEEKEVVLAGMADRGFVLAKKLAMVLRKIASFEVQLIQVKLTSNFAVELLNEQNEAVHFKNKVIILVDDVLNSGKTLSYGFSALLNHRQKKIRTVVLVDRSHKIFPIATDYVGLSLATVLKEHVEVVLDEHGDTDSVYLC